ncbi:MAG: DUF2203 domain-containing protein [Phycisphaeraceae bacterium]
MTAKPQFEPAAEPQPDRKYFTLEEANKALPYVSRIAEDIRGAYRHALTLQEQLETASPEEDVSAAQREYERAIAELNRFVDELHQVGVELKDYDQCLLDFPAVHEGREVYLCWKRGENEVHAWHEIDAGFTGRQDVSLLQHPPLEEK